MIVYAKEKGIEVLISPVFVPKLNEDDVEEIIAFGKENGFEVTVQNFLGYRLGRNPAKEMRFERFYERMKEWEGKYGIRLIVDDDTRFAIRKTKRLPLPFKTGDVIEAVIVSPGRYRNEMIAAAMERNIVIPGCSLPVGQRVRVKIEKSKDNLFIGTIPSGKFNKGERRR